MSENATNWYVRNRGKVLGPFAWQQLEAMRDRGQLARFHEVSRDRKTWMSAASLKELFPGVEGRQTIQSASSYEVGPSPGTVPEPEQVSSAAWAGPAESASWFFSRAGVQEGPVSYSELQRMAVLGQITLETLLWREGMAGWVPAHELPSLFSPGHRPAAGPPVPSPTQPLQGPGLPPYAYGPPRTSGLAIASLVLGILYLCGVGSLLATIFGAVALGQISRSNGGLTGKGMAVAGLVLGILGLALIAFLFFAGMLGDVAANLDRRRF